VRVFNRPGYRSGLTQDVLMGKLVVVKPYLKKVKKKTGGVKFVAVKGHVFIKNAKPKKHK
jgi:hypothetical protein